MILNLGAENPASRSPDSWGLPRVTRCFICEISGARLPGPDQVFAATNRNTCPPSPFPPLAPPPRRLTGSACLRGPFGWSLIRSSRIVHACKLSHFSCVQLLATPWPVAHQAPLSMGFSRQEYWSGLPCPPLGDLPHPGIEPASLMSPALAGRFGHLQGSPLHNRSHYWNTVSQAKLSDYKSVRNDHLRLSAPKQKMTSDFYLNKDNPKWLNFKNKNLLACNLL